MADRLREAAQALLDAWDLTPVSGDGVSRILAAQEAKIRFQEALDALRAALVDEGTPDPEPMPVPHKETPNDEET